MGISFNEIGTDIRKPGVYGEFNLAAARTGLPANANKLLIIGQRLKEPSAWAATTAYILGAKVKPVTTNGHWYICVVAGTSAGTAPTWPTASAGTVTDGTVTWMEFESISNLVAALTATTIYSAEDASQYAGAGSTAHLMAAAAFAVSPRIDCTLITADDDAAAVVASGTFVVTGTAAETGAVVLYIGNVRIPVAVTDTDTASEIATAIGVAINAKKHLLPVTASVATGTVTIRAKNGGTCGNYIPCSAPVTVDGVAIAVTAPASGLTDPDIGATSGLLEQVHPGSYTHYCVQFVDAASLADLKAHIDEISGGIEMRPATVWLGFTDEVGDIAAVKALCGGGDTPTLNHWRTSLGYLPGTRSLHYELAAAYAAVAVGVTNPGAPLNDLVLTGIHAPNVVDRLSRTQIEDLLDNGVTPLHVIPGEQVAIVRSISTYTRNAQGVLDATRLDITTATTLDYVRLSCRTRVSLRFPRAKRTVRVKKLVRSELLDVLYQLEAEPMELVENVDTYKTDLVVEDNVQDDARIDAKIPADIVRGAHVIAMRIDLL